MTVVEKTFNLVSSLGGGEDTWTENEDFQFGWNSDKFLETTTQWGRMPLKLESGPKARSFHEFLLDVPDKSEILRAKLEWTAAETETVSAQARFGLLAPDGFWNIQPPVSGSNQFARDEVELLARVRAADDSDINLTNGGKGAFAGQLNITTDEGWKSYGWSFRAPTPASDPIDHIRVRLGRHDGVAPGGTRPGVNVVLEIYAVVSEADRRLTGSPLATSDPLTYDSLGTAGGGPPNNDPLNWDKFSFTPAFALTDGQLYAVKMVEEGSDQLPEGSPYVRGSWDGGLDTQGNPTDSVGNDVFGLFFGLTTGWHLVHYPFEYMLPSPSVQALGLTTINPGVMFQDTLLGPFSPPDLVTGVKQAWGSAGYSPDVEIPDLVALLQAWIDDPAYDENGTPTGIAVDLYSTLTPQATFEFFSANDPVDAGMTLTIEYVEPFFRAVDKRVALFGAELRRCAPDAEPRRAAFPSDASRRAPFDPEDRTARFPAEPRDEEFC